MSAAHLPPAEPPADNVAELRECIDAARIYLRDAERQVAMLTLQAGDVVGLGKVARLYQRVELEAAKGRVALWIGALDGLMDLAQVMGLQP